MTLVDIGVACSSNTPPNWWPAVASMLLQERERGITFGQILGIASALPDVNKNEIIAERLSGFDHELWESKRRSELTDANRSAITKGFMTGGKSGMKAEWIFWMDDDTVPPPDAITRLLKTGKEFVAGLYFLGRPPYNPIAYIRDQDYGWGYKAIYGYQRGSLFQVDAVGMGCTLIHRSVYERIKAEHVVKRRPDGTLVPIHRSKIYNTNVPELAKQPDPVDMILSNGWLCQRVADPETDDNRAWPFYAMEYLRTEDYWFCELAANVGIRPWIESTVTCSHIKAHAIREDDYLAALDNLLETRDA